MEPNERFSCRRAIHWCDAIFEKVFGRLKKNWIGWKATVTRYVDSGDSVFAVGFYEGKNKMTKRYMKSAFIHEYRIKNEKITEFNQYTDTFLIAEAMGLTRNILQ